MGQKARTQHKQKEAERNIHKTNTEQTKKSQCTSDILNEEVMIISFWLGFIALFCLVKKIA